MNKIIEIHKELLLSLHHWTGISPLMDNIIYILAEKVDNYVIVLAVITLVYFVYQSIEHTQWKRLRFLGIELLRIWASVCIAWGLSYILKILTHLPRPYLRYPDEITKLFSYGGFDSFPSGHATLFMALGFMIYLHHKKMGYVFIALAFIISIARVMSGIHFPIDIISGWLIGGGVSIAIYKGIKHPRWIQFFVNAGRFIRFDKRFNQD